MNKLCPHGRLTTGYCEPCAEKEYPPQCFADPVPKITTCTGNSMQKSDCLLHDDKTCKECPDGGSSDYYDLPPNCDRLHDVIRNKDMAWSQANIFKAAYRWSEKPDLLYNLRKIKWFVEDEIAYQESQSSASFVETKD